MRRRLLLLAFVVAATALTMAILSPWADKAVQEISLPLRHDDIIRQQASDKNLDPSLIAGVIYVESRFRDQTSHAGAKGLMQIMPDDRGLHRPQVRRHALRPGRPRRPRRSTSPTARGTCATCSTTTTATRSSRSPPTTPGEGKVDEWWREAADRGEKFRVADHIPFPETRHYVTKVLDARRSYRREYSRELGL